MELVLETLQFFRGQIEQRVLLEEIDVMPQVYGGDEFVRLEPAGQVVDEAFVSRTVRRLDDQQNLAAAREFRPGRFGPHHPRRRFREEVLDIRADLELRGGIAQKSGHNEGAKKAHERMAHQGSQQILYNATSNRGHACSFTVVEQRIPA